MPLFLAEDQLRASAASLAAPLSVRHFVIYL